MKAGLTISFIPINGSQYGIISKTMDIIKLHQQSLQYQNRNKDRTILGINLKEKNETHFFIKKLMVSNHIGSSQKSVFEIKKVFVSFLSKNKFRLYGKFEEEFDDKKKLIKTASLWSNDLKTYRVLVEKFPGKNFSMVSLQGSGKMDPSILKKKPELKLALNSLKNYSLK
jgi:hypothetical protein